MSDKNQTPAQQWWWDMSEDQKEFWYASRSRFEADRLGRRLRAGWWFLFTTFYLVVANWLWVADHYVDFNGDGNRGAKMSWGAWATAIVVTLAFLWGCFLHFVTIEHVDTDEEEMDTAARKRDIKKGVGDDWDDPAGLDLSAKTEHNLDDFDAEQDNWKEMNEPNPKRKFHWRRNARS